MAAYFTLWAVMTVAPWPTVVPTPERLRELVAKLERPCAPWVKTPYPNCPSLRRFNVDNDVHNALAQSGPVAVPPLMALYHDEAKPMQTRIQAVSILSRHLVGYFHTPDSKVIEVVRSAIRHKDPEMREGILFTLFYVGPTTNRDCPGASSPLRTALAPAALKALTPDVIAAIADEDAGVAAYAIQARSAWAQPGVGVAELFAALKRPEPRVRASSLAVLSEVGRDDPATFPAFIEAMKHPELPGTYHNAVGYVWRFGPKAKEAIPYLIEAMKLRDTETPELRGLQGSVMYTLGRMGADAKPAAPAILKYYQSKGAPRPRGDYIVTLLEGIDPEVAATARELVQREMKEFRRWTEHKPVVVPPTLIDP